MSTSEDMKAVIELAVAIEGMKADVERLKSERDAAIKRAEAAEAERDDARLDLAEAAQHIGKGDAFRATLRAELVAVRDQRDAMDKLWADAVRELQKVDDERIQITAERDALRKVAAFFRSVILSGEKWSNHCQEMYDAALAVQPTTGDTHG